MSLTNGLKPFLYKRIGFLISINGKKTTSRDRMIIYEHLLDGRYDIGTNTLPFIGHRNGKPTNFDGRITAKMFLVWQSLSQLPP